MGINIIQGKQGKKVKVNQGVVIYVKPDGSVQGELLLNEKVIDTSLFSAIIILSEVDKQWQQI
jgi:energy-converting hydrogenase Eha subunit F